MTYDESSMTLRLATCLFLATGGLVACAGSEDAPTLQVGEDQFVRLGERVWVLPDELELRQKLAELPRRRERIVALEKILDDAVQQNLQSWQQSRAAIATLQQAASRLATSDPQRAVLQQQIDDLNAAAIEPRRLGGRDDVRARIVELTSERAQVLIDGAWIRAALPALADRYAKLAADADASRMIREAGQDHRLGPQRSYRRDLLRLADDQRLAATAWVPIFQQSGQTRVSVLVDDRAVTTLTWSDASDQPLVLSASAAEAAAIAVPADAPREEIVAAPGRKLIAQKITLGYLRLGHCVLQGVPAYVLPPEAEDLGSRIGPAALVGHRVRMEPERLRMWLDE